MLKYIDKDLLDFIEDAFFQTSMYLKESESFPPMDAYQDANGDLHMKFALAGYGKDTIDLTLEGDSISVSSKGIDYKLDEGSRMLKKGIKGSKFTNKYHLADGKFDTSKAEAEFNNGILSLMIPIRESQKLKKLEIK